jgi:hypothetical protein
LSSISADYILKSLSSTTITTLDQVSIAAPPASRARPLSSLISRQHAGAHSAGMAVRQHARLDPDQRMLFLKGKNGDLPGVFSFVEVFRKGWTVGIPVGIVLTADSI